VIYRPRRCKLHDERQTVLVQTARDSDSAEMCSDAGLYTYMYVTSEMTRHPWVIVSDVTVTH